MCYAIRPLCGMLERRGHLGRAAMEKLRCLYKQFLYHYRIRLMPCG